MPRAGPTPHAVLALLHTLLLVLAAGCGRGGEAGAPPANDRASAPAGAPAEAARNGLVRPGIDVLLDDSLDVVRGKRVGLVTNHTGVDHAGVASIDRLHGHPEIRLEALFAPEHGIRGTAAPGERIDHGRDERTGLPIHSLYGETRKPTPGMLDGLEALLFDIQDIGARYYTYVYTMALSMEAAGEAGIPFIVLDRPNPLGAPVQGNVLDPAFTSFVGMFPLPMRHGMTPGELARLFRDAFGVEAELTVIPVDGWRREVGLEGTDLPWIPPSPNIPDLESALHYPGTCLFEGTNLSVGRGTERAFQQIGAPWLDGPELARRMEALELSGVRFEAVRFTPRSPGDGKFDGTEVSGVRLTVTDERIYDPARTGVALLVEARRLAGDRWGWRESHFDRLAGTDSLRLGIEAGREVEELTAGWDAELAAFEELRRRALVYP